MPLSNPIRGVDGTMIHEIFVPKDTAVVIGILSSNRSKAIWGEDAEEWKPERWLAPLPETVGDAKIPGVYSNLYVVPRVYAGRLLTETAFTQDDVLGWGARMHVSLMSDMHLGERLYSRPCLSGFKFSQLEMSESCVLTV